MRRLAMALVWFSVSFALMLPDYNLLPGNIVGTLILSSALCVAGASAFGVAVGILFACPVKGALIGLGAGLLLLATLLGAASMMSLMA